MEPFSKESKAVVNQNALGMCITREKELWASSPFGLLRIDLEAYGKGQLKYKKYVFKLDNPASERIERITSIFSRKMVRFGWEVMVTGFIKRCTEEKSISSWRLQKTMDW